MFESLENWKEDLKWCMLAPNSESMSEKDSPASFVPGPASHAIARPRDLSQGYSS